MRKYQVHKISIGGRSLYLSEHNGRYIWTSRKANLFSAHRAKELVAIYGGQIINDDYSCFAVTTIHGTVVHSNKYEVIINNGSRFFVIGDSELNYQDIKEYVEHPDVVRILDKDGYPVYVNQEKSLVFDKYNQCRIRVITPYIEKENLFGCKNYYYSMNGNYNSASLMEQIGTPKRLEEVGFKRCYVKYSEVMHQFEAEELLESGSYIRAY